MLNANEASDSGSIIIATPMPMSPLSFIKRLIRLTAPDKRNCPPYHHPLRPMSCKRRTVTAIEGIIITNCYFSWAGWISLLPTIGSIIRTYCLWQSKMKWVRVSGITTGLFYGSYYIYYNSWFMVLGDAILLLIGIYEVYKNDIRKKKEA